MGLLNKETFICLDCESTGLDPEKDRIIELAAVKFRWDGVQDRYESLINPGCSIPESSILIHHITDAMVADQPSVKKVLPDFFDFVGNHLIVGHGISFDLNLLIAEAKRFDIPCPLKPERSIDTLRLARLYGESPTNSLEQLRQHFNIAAEGAHRAMNDVVVNVEVFKYLCTKFRSTDDVFKALSKPIRLKTMPLGKHKGRLLKEVPVEYLQWAANKDFDQDLLYSIRTELKRRRKGNSFSHASNPFSQLDL